MSSGICVRFFLDRAILVIVYALFLKRDETLFPHGAFFEVLLLDKQSRPTCMMPHFLLRMHRDRRSVLSGTLRNSIRNPASDMFRRIALSGLRITLAVVAFFFYSGGC